MPNIVVNDYKFEVEPVDESAEEVHPILGTKFVRNIFEIDWDAFKVSQNQTWSEVCQE